MGQIFTAAHILAGLTWLLALFWLWQAASALRGMPTVPDLTCIDPECLPSLAPSDTPHLTVIVPARNEQAAIEVTLRSLLASTGVHLQILAINDRSTDATGQRMDAIAAQNAAHPSGHSLDVIHINELPDGWLGKPHAMALAAQRAAAPWLLFTDGDMIFHPQALELALRKAVASKADHLTLVPTLILKTPGERAVLSAMQILAQWTIRLWKVADPKARDFLGVGGFILVRRAVYAQVGGFEALRLEVLDDMRFGWCVKRAGFSSQVVLGPGLVRIRWIQGTTAVVRLLEKNGFSIYRFRVTLHLAACIGLAIQAIVPIVAIFAGGSARIAALLVYAGLVLTYFANRKISQVRCWNAVFFAPACGLLFCALMRSMILALMRGGIDWRGTRYSLAELRRAAGPLW